MASADHRHTAVVDELTPVVEGLGLVLEDAVVTPAGSRRVLRVVVDLPPAAPTDEPADPASGPPAALSLDAVADVSRAVSAALDAHDVMGGTPYVLEVSTPGVDRPLTTPEHFRRNLLRKVTVKLAGGGEVTGRVLAAGSVLLLDADGHKPGMPAKRREVPWADVVRAAVQVEFDRPGAQVYDPGEDADDDTEHDTDETEHGDEPDTDEHEGSDD
ncbi:ribosome maturation factor RimP [Angustibacter aerolatus]